MNYLNMVYGPQSSQAVQGTNQVAGPSSIGITTSVRGSASNVAGPIALIVLLGGLVVFYVATRKMQGFSR